MDSRADVDAIGHIVEPNVFQLHVMDSMLVPSKVFVTAIDATLSTPCNGFSAEFEDWIRKIDALSTPCNGFFNENGVKHTPLGYLAFNSM